MEAPWVTQQLARRYFDAWTSGDGATVAAVLSPSFRFEAGDLGPTAGGVP